MNNCEAYLDVENSLLGNFWKLTNADERLAELIAQKYDVPYIVARVIASRGITIDMVENFIDPKLQNLLPNPSSLKDVDKASLRIADAIMKKEKIAILGDYDVDGATSTALFKNFFRHFGIDAITHIPERDEGYGPSDLAMNKFKNEGSKLVLTVDCGTTAFEVLDKDKYDFADIIVVDHHEAEVKLPNVYAVINPKRIDEDENHPAKIMAAVGVVFLTIVATNKVLRESGYYKQVQAPNLMNWLDIVALGTVCDVVPLTGINRAYVKQGVKIIGKRTNIGIKALSDIAKINEAPQAFHLGYVLGPRINAGGRVGKSSLGSKLLYSTSDDEAEKYAKELDEFNTQRREIEAHVLLESIEMLEGIEQEYPIAFVSNTGWHQGVIGIVAGRLKERYNVPSFVMSIEDDEVKGSARSIPGIDLGTLIISAKEKGILSKGGGHAMAAGFSLEKEKIQEFKEFIGKAVIEKLGSEKIKPVVEIDAAVELIGANYDLIDKLDLLSPYGASNHQPKILIKNVKITKSEIVGAGHVKAILSSVKGGRLKSIIFKAADTELGMKLLNHEGSLFHLVGNLKKDNWNGRQDAQLIIEDGVIAV